MIHTPRNSIPNTCYRVQYPPQRIRLSCLCFTLCLSLIRCGVCCTSVMMFISQLREPTVVCPQNGIALNDWMASTWNFFGYSPVLYLQRNTKNREKWHWFCLVRWRSLYADSAYKIWAPIATPFSVENHTQFEWTFFPALKLKIWKFSGISI